MWTPPAEAVTRLCLLYTIVNRVTHHVDLLMSESDSLLCVPIGFLSVKQLVWAYLSI